MGVPRKVHHEVAAERRGDGAEVERDRAPGHGAGGGGRGRQQAGGAERGQRDQHHAVAQLHEGGERVGPVVGRGRQGCREELQHCFGEVESARDLCQRRFDCPQIRRSNFPQLVALASAGAAGRLRRWRAQRVGGLNPLCNALQWSLRRRRRRGSCGYAVAALGGRPRRRGSMGSASPAAGLGRGEGGSRAACWRIR